MKNVKRVLALVLCLVMVVALCACGSSKPETITIKFGLSHDEGSSLAKAAQKFAADVSAATDERIVVEVYPSDQLVSGAQVKNIESLQSGATQMSFHSNLVYSSYDARLNVVSLPFLFTDYADADSKLGGAGGDAVKDIVSELGITVLAFGENGFRQVTNSVRPIAEVADLAGIKFRVNNSNMLLSNYRALGADPVTMSWGEVFTGLQQGTIDGQENPIDVLYASSIYEVQKYCSLWNMTYDTCMIGINTEFYNGLSAEDQKVLSDCAVAAAEWQKETNRSGEEAELVEMQDAGLEVLTYDEVNIDAIKEATASVYDEFEDADLLALFR